MPKAAAALAVSPRQLAELHTWLRSPSLPSGLAQRARIITLAADGMANSQIAEFVGCSRQTVVLCVDEKSQIQALDRTAPILPLRPGVAERRTHDYVRHGTTTLFAALEVATGKITDRCFDRHRHIEFLAFCNQVTKAYPRRE